MLPRCIPVLLCFIQIGKCTKVYVYIPIIHEIFIITVNWGNLCFFIHNCVEFVLNTTFFMSPSTNVKLGIKCKWCILQVCIKVNHFKLKYTLTIAEEYMNVNEFMIE